MNMNCPRNRIQNCGLSVTDSDLVHEPTIIKTAQMRNTVIGRNFMNIQDTKTLSGA